jgi:hypothetical protein
MRAYRSLCLQRTSLSANAATGGSMEPNANMNPVSAPISVSSSAAISASNSQSPVGATQVTVSQSQSSGAISLGAPSAPLTRITAGITSQITAPVTRPASSSIPSQAVTQPVSVARRGYSPVSHPCCESECQIAQVTISTLPCP